MVLAFYLLDAHFFHDRLRPALAASRRASSFAPCRPLCDEIGLAHRLPDDSLTAHVRRGLAFTKDAWTALVGELLVFAARDVPGFPAASATLTALLAPDCGPADAVPREAFAPIQQAHYGTRYLSFGGTSYRPHAAGWNDTDDVARLLAYLQTVDPADWHPEQFRGLPDLATPADRDDELAFARDWWPSLVGMYRQADADRLVVVCEEL
jgi:hypothetical protein